MRVDMNRLRCAFLGGAIPAQAGTHVITSAGFELGPCLRRDDSVGGVTTSVTHTTEDRRPRLRLGSADRFMWRTCGCGGRGRGRRRGATCSCSAGVWTAPSTSYRGPFEHSSQGLLP